MKKVQRKALIIGISDYNDPHLQNLNFCKNDAEKMYELLQSFSGENKWDISDNYKLVGQVKGQKLRDKTFDFFNDEENHRDDVLLFYYSGHGILDDNGEPYLAYSDINPDEPGRRGFSFDDLTKWIEDSTPNTAIIILDCCYSGSASLRSKGVMTSKADEDNQAKLGRKGIIDRLKKLPRKKRIYILAASQAAQEAYGLEKDNHSIYTYYLLEGLKENTNSVDSNGSVTPLALGEYVDKEIMSRKPRPKQRPITKAEGSENVILATYDSLRSKDIIVRTPSKKGLRWHLLSGHNKYLLLIPIIAVTAAVIGIYFIGPWYTDHQKYVSGFDYGNMSAVYDLHNHNPFNPACDPTGSYTTSDGQHPIAYCLGWTQGYILVIPTDLSQFGSRINSLPILKKQDKPQPRDLILE
ncbi:caspase family protein [Nitrososphaera sp. AFS]|uniref:caspase family protein n=1 Tax=Nitrososphaera sp. AFS TaxID=2301191 RepID=UPI00139244AC|nr:caspase family protein [Nitrososphaera sp. AFS]NAL78156.1 caspase family protein [Nitrososphaera sp. AFS]